MAQELNTEKLTYEQLEKRIEELEKKENIVHSAIARYLQKNSQNILELISGTRAPFKLETYFGHPTDTLDFENPNLKHYEHRYIKRLTNKNNDLPTLKTNLYENKSCKKENITMTQEIELLNSIPTRITDTEKDEYFKDIVESLWKILSLAKELNSEGHKKGSPVFGLLKLYAEAAGVHNITFWEEYNQN